MPIEYEIDLDLNLATVSLYGAVTLDEFKSYFAAADRDPRFHGDLRRLVVTDVTAFPAAKEIEQLTPIVRRRDAVATSRVAVVASTPLAIGLTSMFFGVVGLGDSVEIFPCRVSATAWLMTDLPVKRPTIGPG